MYFNLLWKTVDSVVGFLVYGALIGKQTGRSIEVLNSFELVTSSVEEVTVIDRDYYHNKSEQCMSASSHLSYFMCSRYYQQTKFCSFLVAFIRFQQQWLINFISVYYLLAAHKYISAILLQPLSCWEYHSLYSTIKYVQAIKSTLLHRYLLWFTGLHPFIILLDSQVFQLWSGIFITISVVIIDKQVFPDFDLLGWYTTGGALTEADVQVSSPHSTPNTYMYYLWTMYLWGIRDDWQTNRNG